MKQQENSFFKNWGSNHIIDASWLPFFIHTEGYFESRGLDLLVNGSRYSYATLFKAFTLPIPKIKGIIISNSIPSKYASGYGFGSKFPNYENTHFLNKIDQEGTYFPPIDIDKACTFEHIAKQGILFLNVCMTEGIYPEEHLKTWKPYIKRLLTYLLNYQKKLVPILAIGSEAHSIIPQNYILKNFIESPNAKFIGYNFYGSESIIDFDNHLKLNWNVL